MHRFAARSRVLRCVILGPLWLPASARGARAEESSPPPPLVAAEVRDGVLYGRGAIDSKGLGVAQLSAFVALSRAKTPLRRNVVFLAVADEDGPGAAPGHVVVHQRADDQRRGPVVHGQRAAAIGAGARIGSGPRPVGRGAATGRGHPATPAELVRLGPGDGP